MYVLYMYKGHIKETQCIYGIKIYYKFIYYIILLPEKKYLKKRLYNYGLQLTNGKVTIVKI